jgi:hypothetical protein
MLKTGIENLTLVFSQKLELPFFDSMSKVFDAC